MVKLFGKGKKLPTDSTSELHEVPLTPEAAKSRRPTTEMTFSFLGSNRPPPPPFPPFDRKREPDDAVQERDSSCCGFLALLRRKR